MKTIPICVSDDMAAFIEQARLFLPKMGNLREEADNVLLNYKRHKEQTAQQATSKSLDECLDEACKEAGLENGWKDVEWFAGLNEVDKEHLSDIINNTIKKYAQYQQPHPQDSSSGEVKVPKTEGRYNTNRGELIWVPVFQSWYHVNGQPAPTPESWTETPPASSGEVDLATQIQNLYKQLPECSLKDHMGKWFSYQGTNPLYNQVPPASESLEQAAKGLFKKWSHEKAPYPGEKMIGESNLISLLTEWQSTQQQKSLAVVFPDETWINNKVDDYFKVKDPYNESVFKNGMIEMLTEIRTRMSAANGVDPVKLVEWACGLGLYQAVSGNWNKIDDPFKVVYETTQELLKDYLAEQSQQQNKGK